MIGLVGHTTTIYHGTPYQGLNFQPTMRRKRAHGRPTSTLHNTCQKEIGRRLQYVTPRQTCPQPNGIGRNLRSKTRWFTGFCNSHQVSHFATFFIDARAEISVAESRFVYSRRSRSVPAAHAPRTGWRRGTCSFQFRFLGAIRAGGLFVSPREARVGGRWAGMPPRPTRCFSITRSRVVLLGRLRQ